MRHVWKALVNTIVIFVENHLDTNRDLFILIRFGHLKSRDKGSGPHIFADHSISETCPLEERASPHCTRPWDIKTLDFRSHDSRETSEDFCSNLGCSCAHAVGLESSGWQIWNLRRKSVWFKSRFVHFDKIWSFEIGRQGARGFVT